MAKYVLQRLIIMIVMMVMLSFIVFVPLVGALFMGGSFAFGGAVPIVPFLFGTGLPALLWATVLTGAALFAIGAIKSRWTHRSWVWSGFEIVALAALAGRAAMGRGRLQGLYLAVMPRWKADYTRQIGGCAVTHYRPRDPDRFGQRIVVRRGGRIGNGAQRHVGLRREDVREGGVVPVDEAALGAEVGGELQAF